MSYSPSEETIGNFRDRVENNGDGPNGNGEGDEGMMEMKEMREKIEDAEKKRETEKKREREPYLSSHCWRKGLKVLGGHV